MDNAEGFDVNFKLSDAALTAMKKAISDAIGDAIKLGFQSFKNQAFENATKAAAREVKKVTAASREATNANKDFFAGMTTGEARAAKFAQSITELGLAVGLLSKTQDRARSQERQGQITDRERFSRAAQERLAIMNRETKLTAQSARTQGELQVNAAKVAGKQRVQIMRSVLETIGRLEKALGATVTGFAKTATSAISRTFTTLTSSLRRSNSAFTQGLPSELRSRETLIRSSFSRQEKELRSSTIRQQRIIQDAQRRTSTGVLGAATGRGIGGGIGLLAGGVGIGALLTSGFQRFSDLERINKQFLALTGNIDDTNQLLAQVKQFAKETPFDLVGVADLAKGFLAIKTPVDQVLPRVKAIADAVALTGGGVDSLDRIQRAIGQIVSTGKLQGDELNQLAENLPGLNIRQILADQLTGGNVQELTRLQEAGELSAEAVVNGLITGLASDPRLAGASADLAKTLSGRVANLKESFADFGASLIGLISGPLKLLVSATQIGLQGLSDFIKGEGLGPALTIVRDGLRGVAIALGLIFAAKGAVEVLGLLKSVMGALLTPMGALLIVAGAIGAAISILWTRSGDFHDALSGLLRYISTQGQRIFSAFGDAINTVRDAFSTTHETITQTADGLERSAEPASRTFRNLADTIKRALFTATTFITEKLIPALATVAIFIGKNVVPAVSAGIEIIGRAASAAISFVDRLATTIRPFIQPAIDGFKELGKAIGGAFGGDFADLKGGAVSALSGIGTTIAGIAYAVGQALYPVGQKILTFFKDLFSGPNLKKYASAFLGLVEEIGRIIGTIVSSPAFLKAVAAIAAAAVIIGFRFVEGLARGIASNLPELVGMLRDGLVAGLKALWSNPLILVSAIVLAPLAARLFSLFKGIGTGAGGGFLSGLKTSLGGARDFLSAALSGPGGGQITSRTSVFGAASKEAQGLANSLRILGSSQQVLLSPASFASARAEIARLGDGMSKGALAALRMRDNIMLAGRAVGSVATAVGGVASSIVGAGRQFAESFNLQRALAGKGGKDPFHPIVQSAFAAFNGIRDHANVAFGGVAEGWKTIGRSASTAWTLTRVVASETLDKIKRETSTAFGGVVQGWKTVGKSAQSAWVMTRVALSETLDKLKGSKIAQLGAAFGSSLGSAFQTGIKGIGSAFTTMVGELRQRAKEAGVGVGQALGAGLLAAVGGFLAGKAEGAAGGSGITSALTAGLTGLAIGGPVVGAVAAGASVIGTAFGKAEHAAKVFKERMSEIGSTVRGDLEAALKSGKIAVLDFKSAFSLKGDEGLTDEITSLLKTDTKQALQDAGVSAQELMAAFREGEPAVAKLLKSIGLVFDDTIGFNKAERAAADVGTVFAGVATEIARINLDEAFNPTKIDKAATSANGFWSRMVGGARDFNTTASAARAVQDATDKVALYETALETAKGAWDSLFNIPGDTNLQEVIDNALISVDGMGPRIADALRTGGASADAQVRNIIRDMGTNIESVIKKGVEDGTVQTPEQAAYITKAIFDAAVAGIPTDSKAYQDAADAYQAAIEGVVPTLQSIDSAAATLAWAQALQDQISQKPPSVPIVADIPAATAAGKAMSEAVDTGFGEFRPPAALLPTIDSAAAKTAGKTAGEALGDGLINGINSKVLAVAAAAAAMARKANAAANRNFEISSPSRVFFRMGRFIGEGLANGITDATALATDAVTRLVNRVVEAGRAAGSGAADALRGVGSAIFDGMVGSGAEVNTGASLLQARGAITTALDGLRESLSGDNASTSLDINDALGVQNIQQLTSAFDTIADFGRVMLAQGVDAATVSTELQKQVAVLVQLATSLGFDQQGVEDMAASLGLSGEALGAFVEAAAKAAADLATIAAQVAQIDLFNQSFGSGAVGPGLGGALNTAISGVTNAGQQFLTDWETQINTVFQIGAMDPTKLTASQKVIWDEIVAGQVFGFDPTTVLGAGNLQSITGGFDAIAKMGEAMLAGGADAASVAAAIQKATDDLAAKAAGLGFDSAAVAGVAASLGLSPGAIGDFVQNAAAAAAAATAPNPNAAAAAAAVAALPPAAIPVYHPPAPSTGGAGGAFTPSADAEAAAAAAAAAAFQPPSGGVSNFGAGLSPQEFINAVAPPLAKVMLQALRAGGR